MKIKQWWFRNSVRLTIPIIFIITFGMLTLFIINLAYKEDARFKQGEQNCYPLQFLRIERGYTKNFSVCINEDGSQKYLEIKK